MFCMPLDETHMPVGLHDASCGYHPNSVLFAQTDLASSIFLAWALVSKIVSIGERKVRLREQHSVEPKKLFLTLRLAM